MSNMKALRAFLLKIRSAKVKEVIMAEKRFEKVYSQGTMNVTEIWVDKETGVNYLFHLNGYGGGLTPLLDREGKPVISNVSPTHI